MYYLGKMCKRRDHLVPLPVLSVLLLVDMGWLYCQGGRGTGKNQFIAANGASVLAWPVERLNCQQSLDGSGLGSC